MSRIGKKEIVIPAKTEVTNNGNVITVKGPLGELKRTFGKEISIIIADGKINLKPVKETLENNALWGSYASHITNMIIGVNKGFEEKMIIEGIGYKGDVTGKELVLRVGFSHPVKKVISEGLKVVSEKGVVTVSGIDKEMVTRFAADLRSVKKPEPYKGKGIRYEKEIIRRKEGKKTA
jgi:large subunit ribosomal protein L6